VLFARGATIHIDVNRGDARGLPSANDYTRSA
jgi:hypothetical protein